MVSYTGSASRVVLSDRVCVSLRRSMHIKIDLAFHVVLWMVHPLCFFNSFVSRLSSLFFHMCVIVSDPTRRVARVQRNSSTCHSQSARLGSDLSILTAHSFFGAFLFVIVLFLYELNELKKKNTTSLVSRPCRAPTCVVLSKLDYQLTVPV